MQLKIAVFLLMLVGLALDISRLKKVMLIGNVGAEQMDEGCEIFLGN
jgi:hypothetical protein